MIDLLRKKLKSMEDAKRFSGKPYPAVIRGVTILMAPVFIYGTISYVVSLRIRDIPESDTANSATLKWGTGYMRMIKCLWIVVAIAAFVVFWICNRWPIDAQGIKQGLTLLVYLILGVSVMHFLGSRPLCHFDSHGIRKFSIFGGSKEYPWNAFGSVTHIPWLRTLRFRTIQGKSVWIGTDLEGFHFLLFSIQEHLTKEAMAASTGVISKINKVALSHSLKPFRGI
jgi:hypothetical protein